MSDRQQWTKLADQLDLTFKPGVRGMLESKFAGRIAAQQGQDPDQIAKVMQNPLVMGVLEQVFLGVAMGTYRSYEIFVYRNSKSHSSSSTSSYSVHVQLFWPEAAELGLSIYRKRFWSKIGKMLGAQDMQTGHPELDPLVMIKAGVAERVQPMLENHDLQQALLDLFCNSEEFEVDDQGIEHRTHGQSILPANTVRPLMDRLADAADVIWPQLDDS